MDGTSREDVERADAEDVAGAGAGAATARAVRHPALDVTANRASVTTDESLYERCAHCHLFVEDNQPEADWVAPYAHLHRGDDADEAIDASHQATPSGMVATLATWRTYGPEAMRARFTVTPAPGGVS